jgi:GTP diphosphokinase / guanosine-3',5'-bis(diphosphate) 3'-diphosphatase
MHQNLSADEIKLVFKALKFAAAKHRDQRRKDVEESPYINHPIDLAETLVDVGHVLDVETLCAAILHDTIEDTATTPDELAAEFGTAIRDIVLEVSDDTSLRKAERKQSQIDHAPHASYKAKLVKLADKISNVRDLGQSPPVGWTLERRQEYFDWALAVVNGMRETNSALESAFDDVYSRRP